MRWRGRAISGWNVAIQEQLLPQMPAKLTMRERMTYQDSGPPNDMGRDDNAGIRDDRPATTTGAAADPHPSYTSDATVAVTGGKPLV